MPGDEVLLGVVPPRCDVCPELGDDECEVCGARLCPWHSSTHRRDGAAGCVQG